MGYNTKHVMRGGGTEEKTVSLPWAELIEYTPYRAGSWAVDEGGHHEGIKVELKLASGDALIIDLGAPGKTFEVEGAEETRTIPVESESLYVESDKTGKTVNSFHWPPKDREKEFRA